MNRLERKLVRNLYRGQEIPREKRLSGYRSMWLIVMFDLPVGNKTERRRAGNFRKLLLGEGFIMKQLSIYQRYFVNRSKAEAAAERIGKLVPPLGNVSTLFITDKQIALTRNYSGGWPDEGESKPSQLALF